MSQLSVMLLKQFTELETELQNINLEIESGGTFSADNLVQEQNIEYACMLAVEKIKSFYTNVLKTEFTEELNFALRAENSFKNFCTSSENEQIKAYEYTKERYEKLGVQNHPKVIDLYASYKASKDKKEYLSKIATKAQERLACIRKELTEMVTFLNEKIVLYSAISGSSVCKELKLELN